MDDFIHFCFSPQSRILGNKLGLLPTAEPEVTFVKADLSGVFLDEREVRLAHVVELECEKPLPVVSDRLLAFGGDLRADHAVLQLVVSAHRVLGLAVVVLGRQLLVLAGLVVLLVGLHLACGATKGKEVVREGHSEGILVGMSRDAHLATPPPAARW